MSAGAAKGIVEALAPTWRRETAMEVAATFGAVGAIKEAFDAGTPCDVIVLTQRMIDALAADERLVAGTAAPLGAVHTGIAVRAGDALPDVNDAAALRAALMAANAIYFPDPERATAGVHFMEVLQSLGIERNVASRLRPFPNGATAMRTLADEGRRGDIGCTQMTEIRYTRGVAAVGPLPSGLELTTVYAAAVTRSADDPGIAQRFIALLTGPRSEALRVAGGFDV
ncbi:MAG TPA: substrate-binding domain-containing protein [Casimicrobiaceae bacterium]